MDLIETCKQLIKDKFNELERSHLEDSATGSNTDTESTQNQASTQETLCGEVDRNLNKILNQQNYLKLMIDEDNQMQMYKNSIKTITVEIEALRQSCTRMNEEALKQRQELVVAQAKEIERYQMGQIRSISEDYARHQEILEQRKKEIQSLKKEIEREERDRGAYLLDVEKKLEKQLQDRQRALRNEGLPLGLATSGNSLNDELHNPDHLELTSVDEYAPYGAAPHSRLPARGGRARGRGARTRRGRRGA